MIVDQAAANGRDVAWIAERAIRGGADVIQLRDKQSSARVLCEDAQRVLRVTRASGVPLIINDRADVALASGADGLHVGQDDLSVTAARHLLGPSAIVGKSTHSVEQALETDREAIDYLAFGPIYSTPTKPDYPHVGPLLIGHVKARVTKPLVVIGGIDRMTLPEVLAAGAECIAVVRAVCSADDPEAATRQLKQTIANFFQLNVS